MAIRYSYDDFTTEGHGVIEGEFYYAHKSKSSKRKNKPKKVTKTKKKDTLQSTYNHLSSINRAAAAERRAKAYAEKHSNDTKNIK